MKTLKYLAITLGLLILVAIVGAGIFAATFDPNQYKDEITRVVKEKTDRTLVIPGNIKLAFLPKLGVETGEARLSEYKSDQQFLKITHARLYLDILPLLRKELVIDQIEIEGLEANVVRHGDGGFNFDDLLARDDKKDDQAIVKFDAQGFKLTYANISYTDEASGQTAQLQGLGMETDRLADRIPSHFTMASNVEIGAQGKGAMAKVQDTKVADAGGAGAKGQDSKDQAIRSQGIKGQMRIAGELTFDLAAKTYLIKGLDGKVNGSGPGFSNASLGVKGSLRADPGKRVAEGSSVEVELTGAFKRGAENGQAANEFSGADFKLTADTLRLDTGTLEVAGTKMAMTGTGNYNKEPFDLKLSAPVLSADGRKRALRGEHIQAEAKGRRGEQAGTVTLEAAKVDADLSAQRVALEGFNANGSGAMPGVLLNDFKARVPKLLVDLSADRIMVDGASLSAAGKQGDDAFDVKMDAPRLAIDKDTAGGDPVTGTISKSGKDALDLKFSLSDVKGSGKALAIGQVALDVARAQFGDTTLSGDLRTALDANLEARTFGLARIDANLIVAHPRMPMKSVKLPLTGSARADFGRETASADVSTRFDESTVTAQGSLARQKSPAVNFDIDIDKINVDRYFPPLAPGVPGAKDTDGQKPIDLSALKALDANGKVKVGALQMNNVKASNVLLTFKAAAGRVDLNPISAALYQGTMKGSVGVDANQNSFVVKQSLSGVSINPLMKDAIDKDMLEGRGNVSLDLTATGDTAEALKRDLAGTAVIDLKNGAYKGLNLARSLGQVRAGLTHEKNPAPGAKNDDKTEFTEMKLSAQIRDGVAESSDLDAKSPLLRVGGAGRLDIGAASLDYLAKATIVRGGVGREGRELAPLKGKTIPVKLAGPLDALKYDIEYVPAAPPPAARGRAQDKGRTAPRGRAQ